MSSKQREVLVTYYEFVKLFPTNLHGPCKTAEGNQAAVPEIFSTPLPNHQHSKRVEHVNTFLEMFFDQESSGGVLSSQDREQIKGWLEANKIILNALHSLELTASDEAIPLTSLYYKYVAIPLLGALHDNTTSAPSVLDHVFFLLHTKDLPEVKTYIRQSLESWGIKPDGFRWISRLGADQITRSSFNGYIESWIDLKNASYTDKDSKQIEFTLPDDQRQKLYSLAWAWNFSRKLAKKQADFHHTIDEHKQSEIARAVERFAFTMHKSTSSERVSLDYLLETYQNLVNHLSGDDFLSQMTTRFVNEGLGLDKARGEATRLLQSELERINTVINNQIKSDLTTPVRKKWRRPTNVFYCFSCTDPDFPELSVWNNQGFLTSFSQFFQDNPFRFCLRTLFSSFLNFNPIFVGSNAANKARGFTESEPKSNANMTGLSERTLLLLHLEYALLSNRPLSDLTKLKDAYNIPLPTEVKNELDDIFLGDEGAKRVAAISERVDGEIIQFLIQTVGNTAKHFHPGESLREACAILYNFRCMLPRAAPHALDKLEQIYLDSLDLHEADGINISEELIGSYNNFIIAYADDNEIRSLLHNPYARLNRYLEDVFRTYDDSENGCDLSRAVNGAFGKVKRKVVVKALKQTPYQALSTAQSNLINFNLLEQLPNMLGLERFINLTQEEQMIVMNALDVGKT